MDLSNLFSQFTARESIFILIVMLTAFLFGLLVGYLLRNRRVRELRRELNDKKKELADAQAEIETLREQLSLKDADLKKLGFSLQEAEAGQQRLEEEKEQLNKEVFMLRRQLEEGGHSGDSYQQIVDDLNDEVAALRSRNQELANALEAASNNGGQMASAAVISPDRLDALERKMDNLSHDNAALRSELKTLVGGAVSRGMATPEANIHPEVHPMPGLPDATVVEEEPELQFTNPKPFMDKIREQVAERDDLTRIEGIGNFLEKQLNDIGVYTYEEISSWDSERTQQVTETIGYFEGRIEKDKWVEQAAQLALQKQENPDDFRTKVAPLSEDPTDLTIFEGIGPMVADALKTAGIGSWGELAAADTDRLREILEASGPNYNMHDPATWPAQARLATEGEWALLQEYQEEMREG
ncbi:MAG: helix-hairpin-helix domain-containing protein [Phaeodactylibacter xiamenensis]|uniref:helix-hairpin-helix domain-containing protein n=1 Tax=Phaeodactylibacter xiamenensis TaxID=1524460 RepID=UPI000695C747|nr:helix-hairpin-helix domain-containing protein [Phaeodactylibacter xiamenensis]MCR9051115.1 helix-hairpin-helix domain-containing protein [bacterium]